MPMGAASADRKQMQLDDSLSDEDYFEDEALLGAAAAALVSRRSRKSAGSGGARHLKPVDGSRP